MKILDMVRRSVILALVVVALSAVVMPAATACTHNGGNSAVTFVNDKDADNGQETHG